MNCEETCDHIGEMRRGSLSELGQRQLSVHLQSCADCRLAAKAFDALQELRDRKATAPADDLFDEVMRTVLRPPRHEPRPGFWTGAGAGVAVAASLALAIAWLGLLPSPEVGTEKSTHVLLAEPRDLHVAIDLERDLPGAQITVVLSGAIALSGYRDQRELSWKTDLQAGMNKLTLPLMPISEQGGELLVQVDHDGRRRTFTVNLDTTS